MRGGKRERTERKREERKRERGGVRVMQYLSTFNPPATLGRDKGMN